MNRQLFSLKQFPAAKTLPDIGIRGTIGRQAELLVIHYELYGKTAELTIPETAQPPCRKNELWQSTCVEFFVAAENSPAYWEFNLSPAGHWNVFAFDGYRQNMHEAACFSSLPFQVNRQAEALSIGLDVDLKKIIPSHEKLHIAICAVLKGRNHEFSYWALTHCGEVPNFHLRESFVIEL